MPTELKLILLNVVRMLLSTFVYQRARVLALPFMFIAIMVALFWSARVSADRED